MTALSWLLMGMWVILLRYFFQLRAEYKRMQKRLWKAEELSQKLESKNGELSTRLTALSSDEVRRTLNDMLRNFRCRCSFSAGKTRKCQLPGGPVECRRQRAQISALVLGAGAFVSPGERGPPKSIVRLREGRGLKPYRKEKRA